MSHSSPFAQKLFRDYRGAITTGNSAGALRNLGAGWLLAPGAAFQVSRFGPRVGDVRGLKGGAGCTSSRASRRPTERPTEPLGGQGRGLSVGAA